MRIETTTSRPWTQEGKRPSRALPADPGLERLLADVRLSAAAKLLAVAMVSRWAWSKPSCWPSNATLAGAIGKSVGHTRRLLAELENRGWIRREVTDLVSGGRRIVLTWRTGEPVASAHPPCAPIAVPPCPAARTERVVTVERSESERSGLELDSRPRERPRTGSLPTGEKPSPPAVSVPPVIAVPPTIALTSAEATRLAELPEATRDRIYQWIASGDRLLVGEARRLLSPIAPPKPAPATLEELLGRLTEDPSHVPAAAAALCQAFEDHKSYSGYLARLTEAWHGERDVAELVGAYRQASGPRCRKPGAVFMHALKSDGS